MSKFYFDAANSENMKGLKEGRYRGRRHLYLADEGDSRVFGLKKGGRQA